MVRGNDLEQALKELKRKINRDGIFAKIKDRSESKPSVRRRNKRRKSLQRVKKNERRQREKVQLYQ